jgi:hypothetical protein
MHKKIYVQQVLSTLYLPNIRYNWNMVESGIKHHNPNSNMQTLRIWIPFTFNKSIKTDISHGKIKI